MMKTKLLSLFAASMLFTVACADPAMNEQLTLQQPDQPTAEAANVDISKNLDAGECSVVCPLPNLTRR